MVKPRETRRERVERHERPASPVRTCAGCGVEEAARALVRVVLVEGAPATVLVDAKGGSFGRGAHVHPRVKCLEAACRRGLSRAFKREVRADVATLVGQIRAAYGKRLEGLLAGGVRSGHVVAGADEVAELGAAGRLLLVVLAADAAAAAQLSVVRRATGDGNALVYGDKLRLARVVGRRAGEEREGVGVLGVGDAGLARAIRDAWSCAVGLPDVRPSADAAAAEGATDAEIQGTVAAVDARGVEA